MSEWYGVDMSRVTLSEAWRLSWRHGKALAPIVTVLLLCKRFRGRELHPTCASRRLDSLPTCPPRDVPDAFRPSLERMVAELDHASPGFRPSIWWRSDAIAAGEAWAHALVSSDGGALAMLVVFAQPRAPVLCVTALVSQRGDDILATTNATPTLDPNPRTLRVNLPGGTAAELVAAHGRRLQGAVLTRFRNDADVVSYILRVSQESFDAQVRTGHYVPLTDAELERIRAHAAAARWVPPPLP